MHTISYYENSKIKKQFLPVIHFYWAVKGYCMHNNNKQNGIICETKMKFKIGTYFMWFIQ